MDNAVPFNDGFLKSIRDASGAIEEFEYSDVSIPTSIGRQFFDLKSVKINGVDTDLLNLSGNAIANPRVFFSREINGRYYLGLEDTWSDAAKKHMLDRHPKKILVEFRSMGHFYKTSRVFKPVPNATSVSFHMAPSGDYFVWSTHQKAEVWDLRKYIPENQVILPAPNHPPAAEFVYKSNIYKETEEIEGYDQKRGFPPGSSSTFFRLNVPGYAVHTFGDWFVAASTNTDYIGNGRGFYLSFFGKTGSWQILNLPPSSGITLAKWEVITTSGNQGGGGRVLTNNGVLHFEKLNDADIHPTFWSSMNAQAGNNFLAVLRNSQPHSSNIGQLNSVLRTFTKNGVNVEISNYFNDMEMNCNSSNTGAGREIKEYLSTGPHDRNEKYSFSAVSSFSVWGNLFGLLIEDHQDFSITEDYIATAAVYKFQNQKRWFHFYNQNVQFEEDGDAKKIMLGKGFYLYSDGRYISAAPYLNWVTFNMINGNPKKHGRGHPSSGNPGGISLPDWSNGGNITMTDGDDYFVLDLVTSRNDIDQLSKIHLLPDPAIMVQSRFLSKETFTPESMAGGIRVGEGKIVAVAGVGLPYRKFNRFGAEPSLTVIPMPDGWAKAAAFILSDRLVLTNGTHVAFYQNHDREYSSGSENARVLKSHAILAKGAESKVEDGTKWVRTISYENASRFYNSRSNTLNFSEATIKTPTKTIRRKYVVNDYINAPGGPNSFTESDLLRHGMILSQEETKESFETGAERSKKTFTSSIRQFFSSPRGEALPDPIYAFRSVKKELKNSFWKKDKVTTSRLTYHDGFNNVPRISIARTGNEYRLSLIRYQHEFETSPFRFDRIAQTAEFLFLVDPCADTADPDPNDECSNVYADDLAFLRTEASRKRAVKSNIFAYDNRSLLKSAYEWQPGELGADALPSLDGSSAAASWHRFREVAKRSLDNPWAKAKTEEPTLASTRDIGEVGFYGGARGLLLGKAVNASLHNSALLSAEEENVNPDPANQPPRFGSFGEWETAGATITNELKHSGKNCIKITGAYGPSIDLKIHDDQKGNFHRRKGMVISAWLYMTGANDNSSADPMPVFALEFRDPQKNFLGAIDAIGIRESAQLLPYNKWVKVEHHVPFETINQKIGSNGGYLRIWVGKAAQPCTPPCTPLPVTNQAMYVDDVRLYPSDATVKTFNYDEKNKPNAILDENSDPTTYEYNVWGEPIGSKDEKYMVRASSASRNFEED